MALLAASYALFLLQEVTEIRRTTTHSLHWFIQRYVLNFYNTIDLFLLIPLSSIVVADHTSIIISPSARLMAPRVVRGCNALVNLFSWIRLIQFAEVPLATGPLVIMFRKMLVDIVRYSMLYSFFFVGFTTSLYAIDRDGSHLTSSSSVPIEVFFWMASGPDIALLRDDAVGLFLAIFHVITVGLLLTNMLIAMMANTFQAISENARTEWKFGWAKHIQAAEVGARKEEVDGVFKAFAAMDGVRQQEASSLFDLSEDAGANYVQLIRERLEGIQADLTKQSGALTVLGERMQQLEESQQLLVKQIQKR